MKAIDRHNVVHEMFEPGRGYSILEGWTTCRAKFFVADSDTLRSWASSEFEGQPEPMALVSDTCVGVRVTCFGCIGALR